jgi:hypothetical protein
LRDRLPAHDTIAEFEAARFDRYHDGLILDARGRRLGAMYLLGYFVEMTLKSAFFRLRGFCTDERITGTELKAAAKMAANDLRVSVHPEGYHGLQFWALAIIALRDHIGEPLPRDIALELNWRSQRMNSHWTSSMRYSRDITTPEDWTRLWEDAQWLDSQYDRLVAATTE